MSTVPDPLGIRDRSASLARLSAETLEGAERLLRGAMPDATAQAADPAAPPSDPPANAATAAKNSSLHDKLAHLLERALHQSTAESRVALFHRVLDHLVPDEARLLSALSDGSSYPLVHVYARTRSGLSGDLLLANACLVGKMANVSLPALTPIYVANLLIWGLVQIGPEDTSMKDDYQILMADNAVLKAVKAGSIGPITPRVERHTLSMSALGHELWTAAGGGQS